MANTVKLNGVRPEVIKLHMFPFSLRDTAATWYESLPYGSVDSWDELVEAYLCIFFPPSLTSERRREIIVFKQGGRNGRAPAGYLKRRGIRTTSPAKDSKLSS